MIGSADDLRPGISDAARLPADTVRAPGAGYRDTAVFNCYFHGIQLSRHPKRAIDVERVGGDEPIWLSLNIETCSGFMAVIAGKVKTVAAATKKMMMRSAGLAKCGGSVS